MIVIDNDGDNQNNSSTNNNDNENMETVVMIKIYIIKMIGNCANNGSIFTSFDDLFKL